MPIESCKTCTDYCCNWHGKDENFNCEDWTNKPDGLPFFKGEKEGATMSADGTIVNLSLSLCKLDNYKQIMDDILELVKLVKEETLKKEYEIIAEIFCEQGGFELNLEHDMFRINNYCHFRSSKFEKPFELKHTIQEAVHDAAVKLHIDE